MKRQKAENLKTETLNNHFSFSAFPRFRF